MTPYTDVTGVAWRVYPSGNVSNDNYGVGRSYGKSPFTFDSDYVAYLIYPSGHVSSSYDGDGVDYSYGRNLIA